MSAADPTAALRALASTIARAISSTDRS